jgi:flagellar hook-associated protein 2
MQITPLKFTGISSFSDDFQAIVDRAVAIASLPVNALSSYQEEILADKVGLGATSTAVASLTRSLTALAELKGGGALSVSSSSSKATASMRPGASAGSYILSEITSLAETAVYTAAAGLADTDTTLVDADGVLSLVIDGVEHEIALGSGENTLSGLRDAINGAGLGVAAAIVDSGAGDERFYLTLTAEESGEKAYELRTEAGNPATNLLGLTRAGANAEFKLNGIAVETSENLVTGVIPGVDFTLTSTTGAGEQIELKVKTDRAPVTAALSDFVASYNELSATLAQHRGEAGGSLAGSGILLDLASQLMALTGVSGDGAVKNLSGLGITLDVSGTMNLDTSVIAGMGSEALNSALDFLASETGGLASMISRFEQYSDPVTGYIQSEVNLLNLANERYAEQIEAANERINTMQAGLLARLQAADALLASLDSQRSMLDATIESLNTVTNGRREG